MKEYRGKKGMFGVPTMVLALALTGCGGDETTGNGSNPIAATPAPGPSPTPSPSPAPSPTPSPAPPPTSGASTDRQSQMLEVVVAAHNAARSEVGVANLELDEDLNAQALAYAEDLAASGQFEHSPANTRQGQGENLWAGTAGAFSFEQMAAGWIDEDRFYIHARFPFVSSTGQWQDVGHYTQIVWRDTTALGCGIATGTGRDYLVCRYAPAGNISGQFAY